MWVVGRSVHWCVRWHAASPYRRLAVDEVQALRVGVVEAVGLVGERGHGVGLWWVHGVCTIHVSASTDPSIGPVDRTVQAQIGVDNAPTQASARPPARRPGPSGRARPCWRRGGRRPQPPRAGRGAAWWPVACDKVDRVGEFCDRTGGRTQSRGGPVNRTRPQRAESSPKFWRGAWQAHAPPGGSATHRPPRPGWMTRSGALCRHKHLDRCAPFPETKNAPAATVSSPCISIR